MSQDDRRWIKLLIIIWCLVLTGLVVVVFILTVKLTQIQRMLDHTADQQSLLMQMNKTAFTSIEELQYRLNGTPPPNKPDSSPPKIIPTPPPTQTPPATKPNSPIALQTVPSKTVIPPKAMLPPPSPSTTLVIYPTDDIPEVKPCLGDRCGNTHDP